MLNQILSRWFGTAIQADMDTKIYSLKNVFTWGSIYLIDVKTKYWSSAFGNTCLKHQADLDKTCVMYSLVNVNYCFFCFVHLTSLRPLLLLYLFCWELTCVYCSEFVKAYLQFKVISVTGWSDWNEWRAKGFHRSESEPQQRYTVPFFSNLACYTHKSQFIPKL